MYDEATVGGGSGGGVAATMVLVVLGVKVVVAVKAGRGQAPAQLSLFEALSASRPPCSLSPTYVTYPWLPLASGQAWYLYPVE